MFIAGMVVFVVELLARPQFHRSLEKKSLKRAGMSVAKPLFLLIIDITPPFEIVCYLD
jgi:hypothetical protein